MIVVYTVAFTYILRVSGKGFVFYLMLGQLSWTFFASSASMSTGSIVDNAIRGGVERTVKAGDVVFIPPGVPHGFRDAKTLSYLNIHFGGTD